MSLTDEIKQRVDLYDVVAESGVNLVKAGKNYKANCPFHSEKTPSFYVFPDRQYWQCFGACAEGGDVFSFVQKREGLDFRDALRTLAQRAGLEMQSGQNAARDDGHNERLYVANEAAAAFYHNLLLQSEQGAEARAYFEGRGLDERMLREFQLGLAPGRGALLDHLSGRGFSSSEVVEAGLCIEGERGLFDRFHDRLMFPIRDEKGRVAGLGGRTTVDDPAKYLNTPQTPVFDKSGLLYAFDRARDAIREKGEVVVVEGYMDVIAAHQFDYKNVVAQMGTALTDKQVAKVKRVARRLILALDADSAGSEATLRGIEVAASSGDMELGAQAQGPSVIELQESSGTEMRIVTIPQGKDPDELIRREPALWEEIVAAAKPVADHLLDQLETRFTLSDPRQSAEAVKAVAPALSAIRDPVIREHYVQRLARLVHVEETTLRPLLRLRASAGARPAGRPSFLPRPSSEPVEEFLLALLLEHPSLRPSATPVLALLLNLSNHRVLYEDWLASPEIDELRESLPEDMLPDLQRVLARALPPLDEVGAQAAFDQTVWKLEQRNLKRAKLVTADTIAETEARTRQRGAHVSDLVATAATAGDGLSDEEAAEVAQLYQQDYEQGLELHQRLIDRDPTYQPLTELDKQAIHARITHQMSHEVEPAPYASPEPPVDEGGSDGEDIDAGTALDVRPQPLLT